jgi:hypothetical protein
MNRIDPTADDPRLTKNPLARERAPASSQATESSYTRKWSQADRTADDALGLTWVRKMAGAIRMDVGDPLMHPSIPMKVARALWEKRLTIDEVAELCDIVRTKRQAGELDSPGAYFVASIKRMFQRHEIPWRQPRRGPQSEQPDLF